MGAEIQTQTFMLVHRVPALLGQLCSFSQGSFSFFKYFIYSFIFMCVCFAYMSVYNAHAVPQGASIGY